LRGIPSDLDELEHYEREILGNDKFGKADTSLSDIVSSFLMNEWQPEGTELKSKARTSRSERHHNPCNKGRSGVHLKYASRNHDAAEDVQLLESHSDRRHNSNRHPSPGQSSLDRSGFFEVPSKTVGYDSSRNARQHGTRSTHTTERNISQGDRLCLVEQPLRVGVLRPTQGLVEMIKDDLGKDRSFRQACQDKVQYHLRFKTVARYVAERLVDRHRDKLQGRSRTQMDSYWTTRESQVHDAVQKTMVLVHRGQFEDLFAAQVKIETTGSITSQNGPTRHVKHGKRTKRGTSILTEDAPVGE